jgi:signal peptidase I
MNPALWLELERPTDPPTPVTRLVAAAVCVFATAVLGVLAAWAVIPGLLPGWDASVVTSGSMAPRVRPGDVVVTRPVLATDLQPGVVIRFPLEGRPTLHRIAAVEPDGTITTKGDASPDADTDELAPGRVDGVAAFLVPTVGQPLLWREQGRWLEVALTVVAVMALAWATHHAGAALRGGAIDIEPLWLLSGSSERTEA